MKLVKAILSAVGVCIVGGAFWATPAVAQEKSVRPGINTPFEKPDLEGFLQKFEGESREIAANSKEIVAACKVKPGMMVADVGAGTGLFTRKFALEVGEKGKVFAVDIAPAFLRHIEKTCADGKIKNVETILCDQFSTKLPKNSVDLVFVCDTYHHFEFPQKTLQSIYDALRPGGKLILIDFHRIEGKSSEFILGHVRAGQEVFVREVTAAGFKAVGEENLLKENYFVRFEKVEQEKGQKRGMRTLQHFQQNLEKSFTPAKTVAVFGEPDRRLGSGLIIFEYDLVDGTKIRMGFPGFAPFQYAQHIQKNGESVAVPGK
jgi:SAM-dependent methyltransferase